MVGNEKLIFKGKLLALYTKKVTLPGGYQATFEMIRHPGAALIIPFLSQNRIIMLRQLRPVIASFIYELPAGTLGRRERPLACARREIVEETGYEARKFTRLGSIVPVPGYSTESIEIFKAEGLRKVERAAEEDEVIENVIMTKARVRRLLADGDLIDAKTISALAMCGWL